MAQENLMVIREDDLYFAYPSAAIDRFYHVRSHINIPQSQPYDNTSPLIGLTIEFELNIYKSDASQATAKDDDNLYFPPSLNCIKEIDKDIFENLNQDFLTNKSDKKRFKPLPWISSNYKAFKLYLRKIRKSGETLHVRLKLEDYLPNGLCMFTSSSDTEESLSEFENDICRQAKFHFHADHFHPSSTLCAAPYIGACDINAPDNPALLHYIESFHKSLTTTLHSLYLDYKEIDTSPKKRSRKQYRKIRRNKLKFYDKCHNLIGQWAFMQTLLSSPQNKSCRPDAPSGPGTKDYSVIARNIANIKEGTEALRNKVRHHHDEANLHTANRATRLSLHLAWLSLVLGLLSILLALLSFESFRLLKEYIYNQLHALVS